MIRLPSLLQVLTQDTEGGRNEKWYSFDHIYDSIAVNKEVMIYPIVEKDDNQKSMK